MLIRAARPSDSAAIAKVHVDSWRTTYKGIVPEEYLAQLSYARREQVWKDLLSVSDNFVYLAEDEQGQVVGFANGGPERESDPIYKGELYAIYLLESHQRQGLGRRLVQATAQHLLAHGFASMLVWVLANNPARMFYEKLGGQFIREKPVTLGNINLIEAAYGWPDIRSLIEKK